MKFSDFLVVDAIITDLKATTRDEVVEELVDSLTGAGAAPKTLQPKLIEQIVEREKHGSTGFGKGVAVPHAKHEKINKMVATIGLSRQGVDFNALDHAPVYAIILLLSPKSNPDEHLQAMENIFSNLQKDTFRRFLRQASSREDVEDLIQEADAQQLAG